MIYKRIFVDSDILLDLLLKRDPFVIYSRALLADHTQKLVDIYTSTLILANVHYVISKQLNKNGALISIKYLMGLVKVLSFEEAQIKAAINAGHIDFEDSIQYYIARQNNCDLIISRNTKHYKGLDIPVLTAEEFLRRILL